MLDAAAMAEQLIPASSNYLTFAVTKTGELSNHETIAYRIDGEKITAVYFPPIPKGADLITELGGDGYRLGDLHGRTPAEIASQIRSRLS